MNSPDAQAQKQGMNFDDTVSALCSGKRMARACWIADGAWIELCRPTPDDKLKLPFIGLTNRTCPHLLVGARVPWDPTQADELADDWQVVASA